MITDTTNFELERKFSLNPEKLWHLLTDPRMRESWGAPEEGMVLTVTKQDLRIGGQERHICGNQDAPDFEVDTRWYHLAAPSDAVFTETVSAQGCTFATSLVTYRVQSLPDGCRLGVAVCVSSFTGPDTLKDFEAGWAGALTNLQALAESLDA